MAENEVSPSPVYVDSLEMENVKKVKAVKIVCTGRALTVIGGKNEQGKTTCLDGIAFALGGEKFRPTNLKRDESLANPEIKVTLSNGLIVERKGKNAALKVTDPTGEKHGQALLKEFIPEFALDLPSFLNAKPAGKASILLQIIGVEDELRSLEGEEQKTYNERHAFGQIADQKKKYADELPTYPDAPEEIVTARELIEKQQAILLKNAENHKMREKEEKLAKEQAEIGDEIDELEKALADAKERLRQTVDNYAITKRTAEQLQDESTAEIEASLDEIDATNVQVRANMDKENANQEAEEHSLRYDEMTEKLAEIRTRKKALLDGANLPLPDLSVENGELTYKGKAWDCMAGSEQYRVATAIVKCLNPKCGFVLIDHLEALDLQTLHEFGAYLQQEGLQAITTRVSEGDECSIIIEDGFSVVDGQKTLMHGEF
jgi:hypothetical protein